MKKRKTYDDNFKAQVALEAIKGERTISEIAAQFEVHPNQISKWEKQLLKNVSSLFSKKKDPEIEELEKLTEELYKKIGQQNIELEFLKKVQAAPESVKKEFVEKDNQELSIRRQCEIISFNRSSLYYERIGLWEEDQRILEEMDKI